MQIVGVVGVHQSIMHKDFPVLRYHFAHEFTQPKRKPTTRRASVLNNIVLRIWNYCLEEYKRPLVGAEKENEAQKKLNVKAS